LQQIAWSQKFKTRANRMLGSADPEHIDSSCLIDQLPEKTDDGYECKSWATAYVEFHPNSTYVLMIVDISLYAERKLT